LLADPTKNADRAREWSAGINWYVNRYVKIVTDYEHTSFRMPGPTATPVHDENLILSRIQLAF
jgi:phosphate-selective porin OprO/OprP